MKQNKLSLLILVIFLLESACSPQPGSMVTNAIPGDEINNNSTPAIGIINSETILYAGTDNLAFQEMATLEDGSEVNLLGRYNDFLSVQVIDGGQTGFITATSVNTTGLSIPDLARAAVPNITENLTDRFRNPYVFREGGKVIIDPHVVDFGPTDCGSIDLGLTAQITLQFHTEHDATDLNDHNGTISIHGQPSVHTTQDWRLTDQYFMISEISGEYVIGIVNGVNTDVYSIPLWDVGQGALIIRFNDPKAKTITISKPDGSSSQTIDFTTMGLPVLENGLFPGGKVYFGYFLIGGGKLVFDQFSMKQVPLGIWKDPPTEVFDLRSLAHEKGLQIMSPMDWWRWDNPRYYEIAQKYADIDRLEIANSPLFWMGPQLYNFDHLDLLINGVLQAGWKVELPIAYGYYGAIPQWLLDANYTRDQYIEILREYTLSIVGRYRDKVYIWDIANEEAGAYPNAGADFWADHIGWEYGEMVYTWAREADPDGLMLLSGATEQPRDEWTQVNYENTLYFLEMYHKKGIQIDIVSMQMHLLMPGGTQSIPTRDGVIQTMLNYARYGAEVGITEMDVYIGDKLGTLEEKLAQEASIYGNMMDACLESGVCRIFGTFQISDDESWLNCLTPEACPADPPPLPLLYDDDLEPKQAFWAVVQSLQEH